MNEEAIDDLKQFISATVSQEVGSIRDDFRGDIQLLKTVLKSGIDQLEQKLSKKIDDLSESVANVVDNSNDEAQTQLVNHETRISGLEAKAI